MIHYKKPTSAFFHYKKSHSFVEMKIQLISSEIVIPSLPTPSHESHLRNFRLCLIDQTYPPIYTPVIVFYPNPSRDGRNMNISTRLKVSLSETLSRFYPLAGRIKDINSHSVDCNDEGALFTQAKVSCDLSDFLKQPKPELLKNFLPIISGVNVVNLNGKPTSPVLMAVQLNVFTCGGIAIASMCSHKIVDGVTTASILKFWAAAASNYPTKTPLSIIQPANDDLGIASKLFPPRPRESIPNNSPMTELTTPNFMLGKAACRRFVFDDKAISTLRSRLFPTLGSRFLTVSSLLLKHTMVAVDAAAVANSSSFSTSLVKKQSVLNFRVNIRSRMMPPLSQYSMGNLLYPVHVLLEDDTRDDDQHLRRLVESQREAVAKINDEYLASIQGEGGSEKLYSYFKERKGVISSKDGFYGITSWCNLGFNELDFGWGKPIWVSPVPFDNPGKYLNFFYLLDTVCGKGIEAWVLLSEAAMDILERDQEFLSYATLNPDIVVPHSKLDIVLLRSNL